VSTLVLVTAILVVAAAYFATTGTTYTDAELLLVGVGWTVLTVGFEFLVGAAEGTPVSVTLGQYDVFAGQVWILVPLTLLVAPYLFGTLFAEVAVSEPWRAHRGAKSLAAGAGVGAAGHAESQSPLRRGDLRLVKETMQGQNQQQAYDRGITIFSPDGRLYQVEYAREAVKRGTASIGVRTAEGVVLLVDKRTRSPLLGVQRREAHKVDDHVGAASAGHVADARQLIDFARQQSQVERVRYDEPIGVRTLTKEVTDHIQQYTQVGGARPFGVALLIAGVSDGEPRLFETDPRARPTSGRQSPSVRTARPSRSTSRTSTTPTSPSTTASTSRCARSTRAARAH